VGQLGCHPIQPGLEKDKVMVATPQKFPIVRLSAEDGYFHGRSRDFSKIPHSRSFSPPTPLQISMISAFVSSSQPSVASVWCFSPR
jgi:hypothetical protein